MVRESGACVGGWGHLAPDGMFASPESGWCFGTVLRKSRLCQNVYGVPTFPLKPICNRFLFFLGPYIFKAMCSRRAYPRMLILASSFLTSDYIFVLKVALLKYIIDSSYHLAV